MQRSPQPWNTFDSVLADGPAPWDVAAACRAAEQPSDVVGPMLAELIGDVAHRVWPALDFRVIYDGSGLKMERLQLIVSGEPHQPNEISLAHARRVEASAQPGQLLALPFDPEWGTDPSGTDPTGWTSTSEQQRAFVRLATAAAKQLPRRLSDSVARAGAMLEQLSGRWRIVNAEAERPIIMRRGAHFVDIDEKTGRVFVIRDNRPPTRFRLAARLSHGALQLRLATPKLHFTARLDGDVTPQHEASDELALTFTDGWYESAGTLSLRRAT